MAFHPNSINSPHLKCFVPPSFNENRAFTMFFNCTKYKSRYLKIYTKETYLLYLMRRAN